MKRILLTLFLLSSALTSWSQSVTTNPEITTKDICLEMTHLQESQNFYDEKESFDYALRFILTTDEIYDKVYLEKVVYGEEGGSKKLEWRKILDMEIFYELGMKGEILNVGFVKWIDQDTLILSVHETQFEVSNLNSNTWTIKRKN